MLDESKKPRNPEEPPDGPENAPLFSQASLLVVTPKWKDNHYKLSAGREKPNS
jgi:hypothetical protein